MAMHKFFALGLAGFLLAKPVPGLAGTVHVSFLHPETYTDATLSGSGYGTRAEQWTLDEFGRYFESLGGATSALNKS